MAGLHFEDPLRLRRSRPARDRTPATPSRRFLSASTPVHVQRTKLTHVLNHLLQNAEEALLECPGDNRRVTVDIGVDEVGAAYIRIQDNGEGIAVENLTRIFGHGFTTRKQRSGIGLTPRLKLDRQHLPPPHHSMPPRCSAASAR
jgi:signal transduction histidine kinase